MEYFLVEIVDGQFIGLHKYESRDEAIENGGTMGTANSDFDYHTVCRYLDKCGVFNSNNLTEGYCLYLTTLS